MCFMTKCPYVPPHEFNLDFPHLMLRYRAMEAKQGKVAFADRQLAETDRNGVWPGWCAAGELGDVARQHDRWAVVACARPACTRMRSCRNMRRSR